MSSSAVPATVDLSRLFHPRGVAVIGASPGRARIGAQALEALCANGYQGAIYPVNPKYEALGALKCYRSISELPSPCDVAILAIPRDYVAQTIRECGRAGISFAIVFAAGFNEIGARGVHAQAELDQAVRESGVRILGPNCQGIMNLRDRVLCGFGSIFLNRSLKPGDVAMVTQSGGFGYGVLVHAQYAGIGFDYVVSAGNESDLTTLDFLEYLVEQDEVRILATYMEGVRDGGRLRRIGERALALGKPILVWKVGNSDKGRKAAASHTANLTSDYEVYRTAFAEGAFIEINDVDDLIDIARAFQARKLPKGNRVAIISVSGGAGILFADRCAQMGLRLSDLDEKSVSELKSFLPDYASLENPFDVTAQVLNDASHFNRAVRVIANDPNVDMILIRAAQTLAKGEQLTHLAEIMESTGKPILLAWGAPPDRTTEEIRALERMRIPWHATPGRATLAASAMARFSARAASRGETRPDPIPKSALLPNQARVVDEYEAKTFLRALGVSTVNETLLTLAEIHALDGLPFPGPLVVKVNSADVPHKTEMGGVKLNVTTLDQLKQAASAIDASVRKLAPQAAIKGMLVQQQASGTEVIIGIKNDACFGPIVMLGLGGVFTEIIKDVSYRFAPFGETGARAMISQLRGSALLNGYRGAPVADLEALAKLLATISQVAHAYRDEILEIDLNPVIVGAEGHGALVADALLVLKTVTAPAPTRIDPGE